jgi:hypothetical protein
LPRDAKTAQFDGTSGKVTPGNVARSIKSGVACSVYVEEVVKWYVDTDRFLFSFDP